jgi:hypothetical protein
LAATLLVAINPFQVYYAQEARMYMLLAALTAAAVLALVWYLRRASWLALAALVLLEAGGLYTHYSFVFVILVLNLALVAWLALNRKGPNRPTIVLRWAISQGAVLLLYLPWLPTAIRQLTTWPSLAQDVPFGLALANTWTWLLLGPTIETAGVVLALLASGLVALFGLVALALGWGGLRPARARWSAVLLALWLGLPVLLMFFLGLYRPAYLKFLLVTSPAVAILLACGLLCPVPRAAGQGSQGSRLGRSALRLLQLAAALLILIPTVASLRNYYADPAYARDDYRSIAAYIEAVGREGDSIILNAPGQQEVFGYYYQGQLPVYPLPEARPLDTISTELALQDLARPGGRVFALFWATDESDPQRFVEGWLDDRTYKAADSWRGNVRLVVYAVPGSTPSSPDRPLNATLKDAESGDEILLQGYSLLAHPLAAGDIAQITLFWQAEQTPLRRYKAFVHVLDDQNNIVGQRDAEPGGGAYLTTLWQPSETIVDNYGVPLHPATPPGEYRVEVGLYDLNTGQRLLTADGEPQIWLEPLNVERPSAPAPEVSLGLQYKADSNLGELVLVGYDMHRLGFRHQPDMPLHPGDVQHINLYWRAETVPGGDWQVLAALIDSNGREVLSSQIEPVVGYPTSEWQAGDVWRGQFNLGLPGDIPTGVYRLRLQLVSPGGELSEPFLLETFSIAP